MEIRKATIYDATLVAKVLGDALLNDPFLPYFHPSKLYYSRYFLDMFQTHYCRYNETYIAGDGDGVAMWLPPGAKARMPSLRYGIPWIFNMVQKKGISGVKKCFDIMGRFEKEKPKNEHYYLHAIGVSPDSQGKGVGSRLLRAVLETCDRDNIVAYLETSNIKNLPFYERHGFQVLGEVQVESHGPKAWFMLRKPHLA